MIYLHKILPFFLSPLGIVLLLLIAFFFNKRKSFIFLSLLILLISTNPFVGNYLAQKLEHPYKPIPISSIKENDAVIVLSRGIHQVGDKDYKIYEFSDPNRFFAGLDLIKQKKSDKLIFTAGHVPWAENFKPEGYILKERAISLGAPGEILVTDKVKNTYEESIALTKIIPNNSSIILVTSAFHMRRSKYLFENQGFDVTPFPVDFISSNLSFSILNFIPSIGALNQSSLFIRENIGRLYYKIIY
ncbi:YdcF family protein [Alphaproteobacteria bacterium]|nr:YdcF family protein [Alphaproteobacteria bacterium]